VVHRLAIVGHPLALPCAPGHLPAYPGAELFTVRGLTAAPWSFRGPVLELVACFLEDVEVRVDGERIAPIGIQIQP
jgi:hypothetical protein